MKIAHVLVFLSTVLAFTGAALGDTLTLKNGDRLTGTIEHSDAKEITFKTDYAGEIKVEWSAVRQIATDEALYIQEKNDTIVSGTVTSEESNVIVHTANAGELTVPLAQVTMIRSRDEQQAYDRSLNPSLWEDWSGGANVGFALARGNSETTNLATGFNAIRKTLSDQIKAYFSTIYSSAGTLGQVTANEILGGIRYDKNLNPKLFFFVAGDFTHNELQSLDLQQIYTGGIGWHVINQPRTTFDVLAGVNYTRAVYSGPTATLGVTNVQQNYLGLTLGEDFAKKIGAASSITQDFYYYPVINDLGQYRYALDAAWVSQIKKWFGWQISLGDRYISNPPVLGTKSNDVVLSMGINVSFANE
jgi:putative salt-induced outer membrane protein YdiY